MLGTCDCATMRSMSPASRARIAFVRGLACTPSLVDRDEARHECDDEREADSGEESAQATVLTRLHLGAFTLGSRFGIALGAARVEEAGFEVGEIAAMRVAQTSAVSSRPPR